MELMHKVCVCVCVYVSVLHHHNDIITTPFPLKNHMQQKRSGEIKKSQSV